MMHQRIPIVLTNEGNFFDTFRGRYERVEDETKKLTQIAAEVQYNHKLDNYFQSEVDKLHTMKIIHDDVHKMYTSIRGERFDLDSLADDLDAINRQLDYAEDELLGQYPGYVRFQPAEEPPKQDETKEEEEEEEATDVELSINKAAVATESSSSNATSSFSANCTDVTATPSTSLNLMKTRNQTYIKTPTSTKLAAFGTPREKSVPKAAAAAARPKLVFTPKQTPRRNTPARPVLPIAPPSSAKIAKRQHPWHNTMTAAHSSSSSSASTTDSAPKTPSAKSHPACLDSLYAKFDRWI